ncbi:Oxysterol-binding protein [Ceraceosorus guamensis]|uniref:Oxysterol-binding protein n=1 Tax=Ceraceosorus guamensis TaxID=1522189 RepID=A0A316VT06_9BASI|nr:Oxysterol-binding protein [Ceraceosorus guamensis]PWN38645.1 Oxysterol-binding protein [Ceraceosorus guamensis]
MSGEEVGGAVPEAQKASWGSFIKSIASFSGDLSSMTAPSFILSPVSLTEYPSYWGEHPELFAACAQGRDDVERMTNVLRWFIGTLKGQYTSRNTSMGSEKKPLNPILGELFIGSWPEQKGEGETTLVAEQVSHHPPITAYHISNEKAGVSLEGHSAQKTSFTGRSITVKQVGHAILRVQRKDAQGGEDLYLITLPQLSIEGILWGAPYIELSGANHIISSTGYAATINYTGKGYFSGKAHSFKASIAPTSKLDAVLYSAEGEWSGVSKWKKAPPGQDSVFWDANNDRREVQVQPLEKQGKMESRKVWEKTAEGIRSGNYDAASKDKSRIENEQRTKRKEEIAKGTPHQLEMFVHVPEDQEFVKLISAVSKGATEDTYRRKPRVH